MEKKAKDLKTGVRLNIRKPPKAEVPKNVYKRKEKHKKGYENEKSWPFLHVFTLPCRTGCSCSHNSSSI
ncbi:MAG TPA: hypothetical protein P5120_09085 [Spirochaetota bacterium]|nr:hypothetical protein [Spirochaetota bacterium]HPF06175.1 hypothetical protein [Spirochaetota bacterium]HPJ42666.1 hypothetical protein [Spirochaetota bacterium]HPR37579.1 hypothetical protein [Spirochaetota bacterium]HRX47662.1 hypothetical protein [Spirochaetota bacterium]